MQYIEIILAFAVGGIVAVLIALVFSLKIKGVTGLLINIVAGASALVILSLFRIPAFKLNPLSAFVVGVTGLPGLALIYVIVTFL